MAYMAIKHESFSNWLLSTQFFSCSLTSDIGKIELRKPGKSSMYVFVINSLLYISARPYFFLPSSCNRDDLLSYESKSTDK